MAGVIRHWENVSALPTPVRSNVSQQQRADDDYILNPGPDAQADENFRNAIGGTIFRTPEDFVEYFTPGLINCSFGEVKETACRCVFQCRCMGIESLRQQRRGIRREDQ